MKNYLQKLENYKHKQHYCFVLPDRIELKHGSWLSDWQKYLYDNPLKLTDTVQASFSRLIPALLCGEQSAVIIFSNEEKRLSAEALNASSSVFHSIACDELLHEKSLQTLISQLPGGIELKKIRERSRRFFLKLGRNPNIEEYFAQISHLDRAVCVIMQMIESCDGAKENAIGVLAKQIKNDEARHVHISRSHALDLGVSQNKLNHLAEYVHSSLVELLGSVMNDFENIGIDPDLLIRRIRMEKLP